MICQNNIAVRFVLQSDNVTSEFKSMEERASDVRFTLRPALFGRTVTDRGAVQGRGREGQAR